ncbi:MAG: DUF4124 domain-containing protein [Betaproteobacteria bacterium]|nr:MAG: DUF4124 domain-containing protein [Betaproteobacteria bacterium]
MVTASGRNGTAMRVFFLLLLLWAAQPAHAAVYKCANEKGGVVYQDSPCPPGRELRNLDADPATLSVVPGTPVPAAKSASAPAAKPARVRTGTVKIKGGNPAERKFIQAGMSEAEVILKVGRPDVEAKGRGKQGHRWSYMPTAGDADTLTTLTLAGGKVTHVERKVVR